MAELTTDIRDSVRERYAKAARASAAGDHAEAAALESDAGCCARDRAGGDAGVWGPQLYDQADREDVPAAAIDASLGCGVPTAVADLRDGEVVLDLGSGAGADVLISARRVAPTGRAIGLDMTDEMLELARANAAAAGIRNVEFIKGYLEDMPLADDSVDVVISNCVINLSGDKPKTIHEAARVLRPGGRFAISDVIADPGMDATTKADMAAWTGCIAGALTEAEFRAALQSAGLDAIEITPTHRVHEHAASAIIRARKPSACCVPAVQRSCCEPSAKTECCNSAQHADGTCGCNLTVANPQSSPPTPLACSLDAERFADRRGQWEQLCRDSLVGLELTETGVALRFGQGVETDAELRRLAALERTCCSSASWTVQERGDQLVLTVTGSPEAVPTLQAMFTFTGDPPRPV